MGFFIYEIVNNVNGKRYIGCTKKNDTRFKQHKQQLRDGKHFNIHLQNSYNKHGLDNFSFNILRICDNEKDMYELERRLISENKNLYNISEGGLGGDTSSNHPNKIEINKKKSDANKKRFQSEYERAKCNVFANLTEEELKQRIEVWSNAAKGSKNGRYIYSQNIEQIDPKSGEVIKIWEDACQIKEETNFNKKYVLHCCNGRKGYKTHKGFIWKFKD